MSSSPTQLQMIMQWPTDFIPLFSPSQSLTAIGNYFVFLGEDLLLTREGKLPTSSQITQLADPETTFVFGRLRGLPCIAATWPLDLPLPDRLQAVSLRMAFGLLPDGYWTLAARAKRMLGWDLATRFCGACGTPTDALDNEPAKLCPECQQRFYPQIAPAIMCLVRRENSLLLARSPHFKPGMYSALAGFVEAGESVENCVHREVFEETGIRVRNLRWFASQPWPFPQSLMLAFHADYAGGEITPQPGEIEDARWFSLNALPELPAPVSIASRLIEAGIAELRQTSL